MPAVALTDHGSLAGAVQLYQHAQKAGVKPLIGCEVYVCKDASKQEKGYAHLTLLAESNEGYGNLIKLASAGTSRATTTSRGLTGTTSPGTRRGS